MRKTRNFIPIATVIDIFALFNRKQLFSLSMVCRRYKAIIEQYFETKPCLLFHGLQKTSICWKWSPFDNARYTGMPNELVSLLESSKFVRFRTTYVKGSFLEELLPLKHLWENHHLTINPRAQGYSTETVGMVRNCRSFKAYGITVSEGPTILPALLSDDQEVIEVLFSYTSRQSVSLPVAEIVDFLFRRFPSLDSKKTLSITTYHPLNVENCAQVVDAVKERFMAGNVPSGFHLEIRESSNMQLKSETTVLKNGIGQSLKTIVAFEESLYSKFVMCQIE
ncbi:hypothetical protein DdX_16936 [Ditylenchus destructor]|uniref:F-box domain-containing protein n=1 Tax=Ditylenchus destructor TaxID=166010 RepID=A0AAD4QTQ8_9BILA|nr:hypothetical protein DdX_16936 [Ditylenchus destructor]